MFHGNRGAGMFFCVLSSRFSQLSIYERQLLYTDDEHFRSEHGAALCNLWIDTGELTKRVPNAVDGAGLLVGDYSSSFALELSRELAAMSANLYEPGNISI